MIEDIILWGFKTYNRIIVRLKIIKYKEDFFYYLSSYFFSRPWFLGHLPSDLIFQATYL